MSTKATSLTLLQRLQNSSDEEAWRRFHEVYCPLIRRWLVRRGISPQDADDIEQEVMQVAVAELPRFDHNRRIGALRAWLRLVVANRLTTFWRRENRRGLSISGSDYGDMAEQLADDSSALSRIWDGEYQRALCERLLELAADEFKPQTMNAFRRVAIEGRRAAEVGEELGMSANAVRIAQSRVMRRLRELAEGELD